jgi:hypothetical protein
MKNFQVSPFINSVLIKDNLDLSAKYIVTSTSNLKSRVIDKESWERIQSNNISFLPKEIISDLLKIGILYHTKSLPKTEENIVWEIDLKEKDSKNILSDWDKLKKKEVTIIWKNFNSDIAREIFFETMQIIKKQALLMEISYHNVLQTSDLSFLPSFFQLQQNFQVSSIQINQSVTSSTKELNIIKERIIAEFSLGDFPAVCCINIEITPEEFAMVTPFLNKIGQLQIPKNIAIRLIQKKGKNFNWSLQQTRDFSQKELDWMIEIYQLGFVLPDFSLVNSYKGSDKNLISTCQECSLLPQCGGVTKPWNINSIPCPSLKFNLTEKVLLKYALYGSQAINL